MKLCTEEETYWTWGSRAQRVVRKKDASDAVCDLVVKTLRKDLQQQLSSCFDKLHRHTRASLLSYEKLNMDYAGLLRAVQDAKFAAKNYSSMGYASYMQLFKGLHHDMIAASNTLVQAMSGGTLSAQHLVPPVGVKA